MVWSDNFKMTFGIGSPCQGCEKRFGGCHDTCAEYKAYKKKISNVKRKKMDVLRKETLLHPGIKRSKGSWGRNEHEN